MTQQMRTAARLAAVVVMASATFGCRTVQGAREDAQNAGESAVQAVESVFTDQGAEAVIAGSIADVDRRTRLVLREMGLTMDEVRFDDNARERDYEAKGGDRTVRVELEVRTATTTEIEVKYRVGATNYEKGQAQDVIRRVQARR